MAASAFCSALDVTNVRYGLSVYGEVFKTIPRRLRSNSALDTFVNALTIAFTSVYSRRQSPKILESSIQALKLLEKYLNNSITAGFANTLCAVYLMMICQVNIFPEKAAAIKLIWTRDGYDSVMTIVLVMEKH